MARAKERLAEESAECRRGRGGLRGLVSRPPMDIAHLNRGKKKSVNNMQIIKATRA